MLYEFERNICLQYTHFGTNSKRLSDRSRIPDCGILGRRDTNNFIYWCCWRGQIALRDPIHTNSRLANKCQSRDLRIRFVE